VAHFHYVLFGTVVFAMFAGFYWATSCPPPRRNFTFIPPIRSERPAFDYHYSHLPLSTGRQRVRED
jgi:heme/copper-type cytochrome/quinol oxidase subunit 1